MIILVSSVKFFMMPGEVKDSVRKTDVKLLVLKDRHLLRQLNSLHLVLIHRGANASLGKSGSMKRRLPQLDLAHS